MPDAVSTAGGAIRCGYGVQPEQPAALMKAQADFVRRFGVGPGQVPAGAFDRAFGQSQAMTPAVSGVVGAGQNWKSVGTTPELNQCQTPASNDFDQNTAGDLCKLGYAKLSGRVVAMDYDPSKTTDIFLAAVGGVWESTNSGGSWKSISDNLPTDTIGGMAYNPADGRIVVATGDGAFGYYSWQGHGVWYSDDHGATWVKATGIPDDLESFRVAVDPTNGTKDELSNRIDKVYVATTGGLFQSKDGGATFSDVKLPTSNLCKGDGSKATPNPDCYFANVVTDVQVRSADPACLLAPVRSDIIVCSPKNGPSGNLLKTPDKGGEVIAAVGWIASKTAVNGGVPGAPQNGIYISATGAQSTHGNPTTFTFSNPSTSSFPASDIVGRTSLGVARGSSQNRSTVYAMVQDALKIAGCFSQNEVVLPNCVPNPPVPGTFLDAAYQSTDFGLHWTKVMDNKQLTLDPTTGTALFGVGIPPGSYAPGIQSWYNNWILPDPTQQDTNGVPTRILFGLEEVWESNPSTTGPCLPFALLSGASDCWHVIGRYWNACLGQINGTPCSPTQFNPVPNALTTTHPDQHVGMFIPTANGVDLFVGSDGGVWKQSVNKTTHTDFDNDHWGDGIDKGLQTLQPYDAQVSNDGTVVAGLQDNGQLKVDPGGTENQIFGGDAFFNVIDPRNSKNILEEYALGSTAVTDDGGHTWCLVGSNTGPTQFSTPLAGDQTNGAHMMAAGNSVTETVSGYSYHPCDPTNTQAKPQDAFTSVFNLGITNPLPGGQCPGQVNTGLCWNHVGTALDLFQDNAYVGWCGQCSVDRTQPFDSGLATNVGGALPPLHLTSNGWHFPKMLCAGCGTKNGLLPQRVITSVRMDRTDPRTVVVTLGGYATETDIPGTLGEDVTNVGHGHVFKSTDAGDHFTDITGNFPNMPATYSLVVNGQLVVSGELGVFIAPTTSGGTYQRLGKGFPNVPVQTMAQKQSDQCSILAATYGRGVWSYQFPGKCGQVPGTDFKPIPKLPVTSGPPPGGTQPTHNPNTAAGLPGLPLVLLGFVVALAALLPRRRRA